MCILGDEEPKAVVAGRDHPQRWPRSSHLQPNVSGQTLASHPRHGADGHFAVLAPIHHAGLVQAIKKTAEMVGVTRA